MIGLEAYMTDHQFDSIIDMIRLILDTATDLENAMKKIESIGNRQDSQNERKGE